MGSGLGSTVFAASATGDPDWPCGVAWDGDVRLLNPAKAIVVATSVLHIPGDHIENSGERVKTVLGSVGSITSFSGDGHGTLFIVTTGRAVLWLAPAIVAGPMSSTSPSYAPLRCSLTAILLGTTTFQAVNTTGKVMAELPVVLRHVAVADLTSDDGIL